MEISTLTIIFSARKYSRYMKKFDIFLKIIPLHNVHFVKYNVTVSFMAQVLDTVAYFVSHVLVVDTVTYFDIFR